MKKLLLATFALLFSFSLYSQRFSVEAGASSFSSGAGIMAEYQIWRIGICVGAGSVLNEKFTMMIRPGGGLRFYFVDTKIGSPYVGVSYGRTNYHVYYTGGIETKLLIQYGPSAVAGFNFLFGKRDNFLVRVGLGGGYVPTTPAYGAWPERPPKWNLVTDISIGYNISFIKD